MATVSGNDIYRQRIGRAQAEMERQGVEYLFVTPSSDLTYLLGYPAHPSERMTLLGVPQSGEPFVVAPTLEASRLDARREFVDVHRWEETESPVQLVAQLVEGAAGATIGIGDQTWAVFLLRLQEVLPDATFVSGTGILRELRMIKDDDEIRLMQHAGARVDAVWEKFIRTTTLAGRTERDVADEIRTLMKDEGLSGEDFVIVGSGPNSASPHHMTSERRIQKGDAVVIDFGMPYQHYWSDITRTLHVGEPEEEFRVVYDTVVQANRAAREAVRPGIACEAIDRAARSVIETAGYGGYFIHRVGHGLGLDVHEEPYMVSGNTMQLRAGMVFSDEPGIYIPGRFGVRVEDILLCTDDGAQSFNDATRELVISH